MLTAAMVSQGGALLWSLCEFGAELSLQEISFWRRAVHMLLLTLS